MIIKMIGLVVAFFFSALGSAFGVGVAALSAVGGWKKCYANGKPAAFMMVGFAGAPLTQTIYGFLLKNFIQSAMLNGAPDIVCFIVGVLGGAIIGLSAYLQGRCSASACDALAETGKGTSNYLIVIGIIETVALFTLVFSLLILNSAVGL
jgi:V/A-type H+/Na+-transporting ATPase subunit K